MSNIDMLEVSLKKEIQRDIKIATSHLKGSILDDEDMDVDKKMIIDQVTNKVLTTLERKVDKADFREFLTDKTSKKEHEMTLRMVNLLH